MFSACKTVEPNRKATVPEESEPGRALIYRARVMSRDRCSQIGKAVGRDRGRVRGQACDGWPRIDREIKRASSAAIETGITGVLGGNHVGPASK
jgi:hypothetical protein